MLFRSTKNNGSSQKTSEKQSSAAGRKKGATVASINQGRARKVEDAFELMDRLDNPQGQAQADKKPEQKKGFGRSGIRLRIGLDALISESDTRGARESGEIKTGESTLLDIGITLPYIWKIPVIGKTALKIVKYFQAEETPEKIGDILKSLRRRK